MSVFNLIKSRRSVYQFNDNEVGRSVIDHCLEAAVWAPNHKLTEPWRFWVLGKEVKQALGQIYADNRALKKFEAGSKAYQEAFDHAIQKFDRIPRIVLVGQVRADDPVVYKEDYAACSCAIQNFSLAAWEQKLGVQWSTGPIIHDQRTYDLLGIESNQIDLIGALYCGYWDCLPRSNRKAISEVTAYLE